MMSISVPNYSGSCLVIQGRCTQPCTWTYGPCINRAGSGLTPDHKALAETQRTICGVLFRREVLHAWVEISCATVPTLYFSVKIPGFVSCPLCTVQTTWTQDVNNQVPSKNTLNRAIKSLPHMDLPCAIQCPLVEQYWSRIMPPWTRHRYKPGKRERQETTRTEGGERSSCQAKAANNRPPRNVAKRRPRRDKSPPLTLYSQLASSSSSLHRVPTEDEEWMPANLEADETVAMDNEESYETVELEPDPMPATTEVTDDKVDEVADVPSPRTPPAALLAASLPEQSTETGQTGEQTEDFSSLPTFNPGWLFNADVIAFANAYNIQSAIVGGNEILIPRPKQAPVAGTSSSPTASAANYQEAETSPALPRPAATRRSRWPGWTNARPATNPSGTERKWRPSLFALNLKRPWCCNWRQMYQEMHRSWQLLSTRSVEEAWRLACGYRLAFHRRQWPRIQIRLANISGHPRCKAIRRLIRTHQHITHVA